MRTRWSDERLDDLRQSVDEGFGGVKGSIDRLDGRVDRLDGRIDRLQQTMVVVAVSICTTMFAGFGALITLFATHF